MGYYLVDGVLVGIDLVLAPHLIEEGESERGLVAVVGGWVGWVEESEMVRMRCWGLLGGGWVGGWVGEKRIALCCAFDRGGLGLGQARCCGRWVGGWVGEFKRDRRSKGKDEERVDKRRDG